MTRRTLLSCLAAAPLLADQRPARVPGVHLRLALNAYSFDKPLRAGTMTLADVVRFCAEHRVDALDATGYYFPGYPAVPPDDYIYELKRLAFVNGVQLSGTGVRNDFATADPAARAESVKLVKDWIVVAQKLGAPVIRVFSGPARPAGHSFDEALGWMATHFRDCAAFGREHGVILGLQQHNDFLKTAGETIRLIQAVDSPWFADILDIGSLREGDPYSEIEKMLPYAVSWQIKQSVWYGAKETPTDLPRIKAIIDRGGYRGVLPFEALGSGDPRARVASFLEKIRGVFAL
ncbi:MAG: sugar phosphate isomerase/epimerase [Acidobacteria bacterium]|nr:sugar phosphate isomerase/epimerase [Acidobacteriota bacterium]